MLKEDEGRESETKTKKEAGELYMYIYVYMYCTSMYYIYIFLNIWSQEWFGLSGSAQWLRIESLSLRS